MVPGSSKMQLRPSDYFWMGARILCIPCCWYCGHISRTIKYIRKYRKHEASILKPPPRKCRAFSTISGKYSNKPYGPPGRLPPEIRHKLYICALGNNILPILHNRDKGRLTFFDGDTYSVRSLNIIVLGSEYCSERQHHERISFRGKLALMKTCRQIYIEAMPVLYQTSTFAFINARNLDTFLYFSRSIRPERLVSIRFLYIRCEARSFEKR